MHVYSCIIHNSQKVKTAQMSMNMSKYTKPRVPIPFYSPQNTYSLIVLIWNIQNKQIYKDKNLLVYWVERARWQRGDSEIVRRSFWKWWKYLRIDLVIVAHVCEYTKAIHFNTLSRWIILYVGYILIKVLYCLGKNEGQISPR